MILILLLGEKRLTKKPIWPLAATGTEHNATWRLRLGRKPTVGERRPQSKRGPTLSRRRFEWQGDGRILPQYGKFQEGSRRLGATKTSSGALWETSESPKIVSHTSFTRALHRRQCLVDHIPGWDAVSVNTKSRSFTMISRTKPGHTCSGTWPAPPPV